MSPPFANLTLADLEEVVRRVIREEMGERVLTTEQAAAALGRATKTVRRLAEKGKLHGEKKGQTWRFKRGDVEAFRRCRDDAAEDRTEEASAIVASLRGRR